MEFRLATGGDAAPVARIYRPFVASTPISFETEPPDADEMRRRIDDTLGAYPWLICEDHGEVVGYAYAGRHHTRAGYRWSVDTTVYLEAGVHRRGVGRGLYTSLLEIVTAQGFFTAYAGITLPNPGSVGLHEAVGFRPVGVYRNAGYKMGAWHDVGWWQRPLQAPVQAPRPPRTLDQMLHDPSWPRMLGSGLSCIRQERERA
jgi:phosphinothricin acetyltransferase